MAIPTLTTEHDSDDHDNKNADVTNDNDDNNDDNDSKDCPCDWRLEGGPTQQTHAQEAVDAGEREMSKSETKKQQQTKSNN
jgi:hypothetical protein